MPGYAYANRESGTAAALTVIPAQAGIQKCAIL